MVTAGKINLTNDCLMEHAFASQPASQPASLVVVCQFRKADFVNNYIMAVF